MALKIKVFELCEVCGKPESDHPRWLDGGGWTHDFRRESRQGVKPMNEPYDGAYTAMEKSFLEERAQHEELRRDCAYHANHISRMIAGDSFLKMNKGDREIIHRHLEWLQSISEEEPTL